MMIELWVKKRTVVTHPTQTMNYVLCFQLVAQAARTNLHCTALRKLVCYRQPQACNILWTKSEHKILHNFCKHINNKNWDIGMLSKDLATELLYKPEPNSKIWTVKHLLDCLSLSLSTHYLVVANKWAQRQFEHYNSAIFGAVLSAPDNNNGNLYGMPAPSNTTTTQATHRTNKCTHSNRNSFPFSYFFSSNN